MRLILSLCLLVWPLLAQESQPTTRTVGKGILDRVVVVGASVSAGFGLEGEIGYRTSLADIVQQSIVAEHQPVQNRSGEMFFMSPEASGKRFAEGATEDKATLLLALDFLFWFGYGIVPDEAKRLDRLEKGLALLDKFECPIVVGDFPNMTQALEAPVKMLSKNQVPAPETIEKLNVRVRAWAAGKKNVVLVPLADLCTKMQKGEAMTIRDTKYAEGELKNLLQNDGLHTNLEGTCAVWLVALDCMSKAKIGLADDAVLWNPKKVAEKTRVAAKEGKFNSKPPRRQRGAESRPAESSGK